MMNFIEFGDNPAEQETFLVCQYGMSKEDFEADPMTMEENLPLKNALIEMNWTFTDAFWRIYK